jgi:CheY-like chemotaxis protein
VECVPTGEAAMEKLQDRDYDLLISDLRMLDIAAGLEGLDFDLSDLIRQADQLLPESVPV